MSTSEIPEDAPEHCPGTQSEEAGKAAPCAGCPNQGICSSGEMRNQAEDPALAEIAVRMRSIKHKILILSGKGGVGKSTVSSTLARALAASNKQREVALLDIDICGPSQPRMMGAEGQQVHQSASGWSPVYVEENLCVMSIGFLLDNRNDAVIWRGPRKNGMIKQFLKDVDWGDIDYLLIDTPPGTSDEHMSIVQYLLKTTHTDGAVVVTTPQEVSLLDVRKEVSFCRKVDINVLGVVENMSGYSCPKCSECSELFPSSTGGATQMCADLELPLLAQIPLDPRLGQCCDGGENFLTKFSDTPVAKLYAELANKLVVECEKVA